MNIQIPEAAKQKQDELRKQISALVDQYAAIEFLPKAFEPGQTLVPHRVRLSALKNSKIWLRLL